MCSLCVYAGIYVHCVYVFERVKVIHVVYVDMCALMCGSKVDLEYLPPSLYLIF